MGESPKYPALADSTKRDLEQQLREVNEALVIASVRQHDLAEQAREAERQLAKTLLYANDIIATLREPFVVLNVDLRVRSANRAFYDSFHVVKEETENRLVYELGNGQWDIPALRTLLDQVLSRNQSVHDFEVEHTFPTLGRKTMLLNARPFPPDSRHPELILLAVQDVSELRERANQLAEAGRRKDQFLAMLSHELRSPLSPILNAIQFLQLRDDPDPEQQESHSIIERQVKKLVRLVDDLLEVSRVTTGRIHLQEERVDLRDIVRRALETTELQTRRKQQSVAASISLEPMWVYGDVVRLEQVIANLIDNASKYTDPGGHIWIELNQEMDEAVLRVRDSGIGISPEILPIIFELFTQADKSLDRSQGGLGIGLALVHSIITLHHGKVEAHSTFGQGSEFVARLPLLSSSPTPASVPLQGASLPVRPLKLLVVDDHRDAATGLTRLLRSCGHSVHVASDASEAMQAALQHTPEIVLLDIGLPVINGYDLAKWFRQQPALKEVMLVAVTGYGQKSDMARSQEAGINHHLVKPVDFAKVESILSAVAEKAR